MSAPFDLSLIGRSQPLFEQDMKTYGPAIAEQVREGRFLVVGGAGSIGSAVVRELFGARPRVLHVVDISENNLAELVRDIRSSLGYIPGDFRTFCIDCNSDIFQAMVRQCGPYDYVLNFSALKHVRSEKDPYTLMRLVEVNIFGTLATLQAARQCGARKYFCVSTDKATNPVSMMGASKRIMEMFLMRESRSLPISSARFANVVFSDGSLTYSWIQRMRKGQPIVAPHDVKRYFVTDREGAQLCLLSTFLGDNRDILFPKPSDRLSMVTFAEIAQRYLRSLGYEPVVFDSEQEARDNAATLPPNKKWPCYFFASDTSGEKDFEEFYTDGEQVDWSRFAEAGVVKNDVAWDEQVLQRFTDRIGQLRQAGSWTKADLVELFCQTLNNFTHKETFKYLDDKM